MRIARIPGRSILQRQPKVNYVDCSRAVHTSGHIRPGYRQARDRCHLVRDSSVLPYHPGVDDRSLADRSMGYPVIYRDQPHQHPKSLLYSLFGAKRHAMTKHPKPLLRVLAGEPVWPPPLWLMRQAGRYLPEYRAIRAKVTDFIALCTTPELAAEVTLQPIRRYGFDAAILFSDILMLPWALGQGLAFRAGEGPVLPPLRDAAGLARLRPERVQAAVAPIIDTVRRVRIGLVEEGFSHTTLIGFAGAPFTVACYMVEGSGSRDFAATRRLAYHDSALFHALLDTLVHATLTYLEAQVAAGAEVLMLFDTWAGLLPPAQFRVQVIEPTRQIVAQLRQRCPGVPVIGFPRLAGLMLSEYVTATGVDAVGLDTTADIALAARQVPDRVALQGNLDPFAVVAGGEAMAGQVHAILQAMHLRPLLFNLGHGIVPETPPEHVGALVEQVRSG